LSYIVVDVADFFITLS